MTKRFLMFPLAALIVLAACGKTDSPETAVDSVLATVPPVPEIPHLTAFDLGRQADPNGRIFGGTTDLFAVGDTVVVSLRAQYTKAGDVVSARLRQGKRTLDSLGVTLPAPDSTGFATVPLRFSQTKRWATGRYQIETFLGTASQGIKDFTVN